MSETEVNHERQASELVGMDVLDDPLKVYDTGNNTREKFVLDVTNEARISDDARILQMNARVLANSATDDSPSSGFIRIRKPSHRNWKRVVKVDEDADERDSALFTWPVENNKIEFDIRTTSDGSARIWVYGEIV